MNKRLTYTNKKKQISVTLSEQCLNKVNQNAIEKNTSRLAYINNCIIQQLIRDGKIKRKVHTIYNV